MVDLLDLVILLIGCVAGFLVCVALRPRLWPDSKPRTVGDLKPGFSLRDLVRPARKPEAVRKMPTQALPRNIGSWRRQKAELERDHNSKQKERDLRIAGLY